jgi:hypothetical protein
MNRTNIHAQTSTTKTWNPAANRFEFSFAFAFRTREQYLEFRRQWKENYAALSTSLRHQKALIRETMRNHEHAGTQQVQLLEWKREATLQLLMLKSAKQEAGRQREANKQLRE